jgi:hypothetical protein
MDKLLKEVLDAHGGLDAWGDVTRVQAETSLDGPFWDWRGWPRIRRTQTVTLDPKRQHITLEPFVGEGTRSLYEAIPVRVAILGPDGEVLAERQDPLASFPPYTDAVAWDELQLAYFTGTANWNYLVEPFLFTYPGVEAREIEPWHEDGQVWRRLAVTFPPDLPNHNPEQTFYYGDDFLLRRMDYSPDITGSSLIAHYVYEPRRHDGFVFYGRRAVHLRDAEGVANKDFAPILIGTHSVTVTSGKD